MIGNAEFLEKAFRITITMFLMLGIEICLSVFRIGLAHENGFGWKGRAILSGYFLLSLKSG